MVTDNSFFVGWGTLALITAGLAQSKKRSGTAWFLLSLIGGPIATLLVVVMPPTDWGAAEGNGGS
jgi:hypothetical protein